MHCCGRGVPHQQRLIWCIHNQKNPARYETVGGATSDRLERGRVPEKKAKQQLRRESRREHDLRRRDLAVGPNPGLDH
jgi:hypothetical protein